MTDQFMNKSTGEPVTRTIRTTCEWKRSARWKTLLDFEYENLSYTPGRIIVEYFINSNNRPEVVRVLIMNDKHVGKRRPEKIYTEIPEELKQTVANIVSINERNYGKFVHSVILPNGEITYV